MTGPADRLRQLAEQGTPSRSLDVPDPDGIEEVSAKLAALAPVLAVLLADTVDALARLDAWDHMDAAADGRYWREDVIRPVLARVCAAVGEDKKQ